MLTFNWVHMSDADYAMNAEDLLQKYKHSPYRNRVTMRSNVWITIKAPIRDFYEMRKWSTQQSFPTISDPLIASFCWLSEVSAPTTDWIAAPVVHLEFVSYVDCRLDPSLKHHANIKPGQGYGGGKEPKGGGELCAKLCFVGQERCKFSNFLRVALLQHVFTELVPLPLGPMAEKPPLNLTDPVWAPNGSDGLHPQLTRGGQLELMQVLLRLSEHFVLPGIPKSQGDGPIEAEAEPNPSTVSELLNGVGAKNWKLKADTGFSENEGKAMAVDPTSFMRQSETIEATTPEISVAPTSVASYFTEVKKSLDVPSGKDRTLFDWDQHGWMMWELAPQLAYLKWQVVDEQKAYGCPPNRGKVFMVQGLGKDHLLKHDTPPHRPKPPASGLRWPSAALPSHHTKTPVRTEDDLLYMRTLPTFNEMLRASDAEALLSFLTVPYIRMPLVMAFFTTGDRVNSLFDRGLQEILEALWRGWLDAWLSELHGLAQQAAAAASGKGEEASGGGGLFGGSTTNVARSKAQQSLDKYMKTSCNIHAHILLLLRNVPEDELDERSVSRILSSFTFLSLHHTFNQDFLDIPETELFEVFQHHRRGLVRWFEKQRKGKEYGRFNRVLQEVHQQFSTIDSSSAVDTSHFEWGCVKGDSRNAGRYAIIGPRRSSAERGDVATTESNDNAWIELNIQLLQVTVRGRHVTPLETDTCDDTDFKEVLNQGAGRQAETVQCAALLSTNIVRVRELLPGPLILLHVRGFKVMSSGFMDL
eukprot:s4972_g1.t1